VFDKATQVKPFSIDAHGNYAAALVDLDRFDEALARYREILASDPNQVDRKLADIRGNYAWALLKGYQREKEQGTASADDSRLAEAEAQVRKAIEFHPAKPNLHNTLAIARFHQGDVAGAEQAFRRALESDPNHLQALGNLAAILAAQNRPAEAMEFQRRAAAVTQQKK
jgi:Flp pilus assembly protein TadD